MNILVVTGGYSIFDANIGYIARRAHTVNDHPAFDDDVIVSHKSSPCNLVPCN